MALAIDVGQHLLVDVPLGSRTISSTALVRHVGGRAIDTSLPLRHGVPIPVRTEHVLLTVPRPDAAYTMRCSVLKVTGEGLMLGLPPAHEIERLQRRKYVRVQTRIKGLVELDEGDTPVMSLILNLSGGAASWSTARRSRSGPP